MLRLVSWLVIAFIGGAVGIGLAGVAAPAFGWDPAAGGGSFTLDAWCRLLSQPGLQRSSLVSFISGLTTAAISLAAVFLFIAGWHDTRLFRWMQRLLSPLLSLPHAAVAAGLAFLITPSGLISRAVFAPVLGWDRPPDILIVNDPWGLAMMAGLVIKEIPFLLLMSLAALPQVEAGRRVRLARSLGYGPVCGWLKAVAPALYPLLRLPVYAVVGYASSSVDVAMILGPGNPPVLAVEIVRWMNDPDLAMRSMAAAGALLQLGVTLAAILVWIAGERLVGTAMRAWSLGGARRCADGVLALASAVTMTAAALAACLGLLALAVASVARSWRFPALVPQQWTLDIWTAVLKEAAGPLASTLAIGLGVAILSVAGGICVLEVELRRARPASAAAMALLYAPLILPQIIFLFSLAIATEWSGFAPTAWLVAAGHLLFVFPYVYLSLAEPYRRFDPRLTMTAQSLGAGQSRVFRRIRLPMLLGPALTAGAVGFAVSIGLYLPTLLLGAGRVTTITTEAVALAAGGDRRSIGAWAMMQALLPAVGFAVALFIPRFVWRNRRAMRDIG